MERATYSELRREAFPYARRIVDFEGYWVPWFNAADIEHQVELQAGAIASTAVTRGHTIEQTVARVYPELFADGPCGCEHLEGGR